jgi:hypothetical protein
VAYCCQARTSFPRGRSSTRHGRRACSLAPSGPGRSRLDRQASACASKRHQPTFRLKVARQLQPRLPLREPENRNRAETLQPQRVWPSPLPQPGLCFVVAAQFSQGVPVRSLVSSGKVASGSSRQTVAQASSVHGDSQALVCARCRKTVRQQCSAEAPPCGGLQSSFRHTANPSGAAQRQPRGFVCCLPLRLRVLRAAPVLLRDLSQKRPYLGGLHLARSGRSTGNQVHQAIKLLGVFDVRQFALIHMDHVCSGQTLAL